MLPFGRLTMWLLLLWLQIGKIGALTYGFLVHLKQAIDVEKVALGQGPAGVTGTDNAENFNPYIDPASIGPSVGRKMLLRAA